MHSRVTPAGLAALVPLLALSAGCSRLQVASAGELGCEPKTIQISHVERAWASESWRAACGDEVYQCSALATAQAVAYSCRPFEGASASEADDEDTSEGEDAQEPGDTVVEGPSEEDLVDDDGEEEEEEEEPEAKSDEAGEDEPEDADTETDPDAEEPTDEGTDAGDDGDPD
jgi:hypothetical protein